MSHLDEDLVETSFEVFYRSEYGSVLGLARAMTRNRAAAEDLTQESFAAAHRHWDRVSGYDRPEAWIRRVLVNRATSLRRRFGAELRALTKAGHDPDRGVVRDLSPETTGVWEEVERLPRRQQQALVLHYVGQLSMDEIAEVMGCTAGAVKAHLHKARQTLRPRLAHWSEV